MSFNLQCFILSFAFVVFYYTFRNMNYAEFLHAILPSIDSHFTIRRIQNLPVNCLYPPRILCFHHLTIFPAMFGFASLAPKHLFLAAFGHLFSTPIIDGLRPVVSLSQLGGVIIKPRRARLSLFVRICCTSSSSSFSH